MPRTRFRSSDGWSSTTRTRVMDGAWPPCALRTTGESENAASALGSGYSRHVGKSSKGAGRPNKLDFIKPVFGGTARLSSTLRLRPEGSSPKSDIPVCVSRLVGSCLAECDAHRRPWPSPGAVCHAHGSPWACRRDWDSSHGHARPWPWHAHEQP